MKFLKLKPVFNTAEEVAQFRKELEDSTEEKFKEIDRIRREVAVKARTIMLD